MVPASGAFTETSIYKRKLYAVLYDIKAYFVCLDGRNLLVLFNEVADLWGICQRTTIIIEVSYLFYRAVGCSYVSTTASTFPR